MSLHDIFKAGFTRRWHTNHELAHIEDRVDGHSARVARIILYFNPAASAALLAAALRHDDGEAAVGDMKAPLKVARPDIAAALDQIETSARVVLWGDGDRDLSDDEADWLHFADKLDAYMWAAHHGANLSRDGWPECLGWLMAVARRRRIAIGLSAALNEVAA